MAIIARVAGEVKKKMHIAMFFFLSAPSAKLIHLVDFIDFLIFGVFGVGTVCAAINAGVMSIPLT